MEGSQPLSPWPSRPACLSLPPPRKSDGAHSRSAPARGQSGVAPPPSLVRPRPQVSSSHWRGPEASRHYRHSYPSEGQHRSRTSSLAPRTDMTLPSLGCRPAQRWNRPYPRGAWLAIIFPPSFTFLAFPAINVGSFSQSLSLRFLLSLQRRVGLRVLALPFGA